MQRSDVDRTHQSALTIRRRALIVRPERALKITDLQSHIGKGAAG
ncbi:hypothetical protein [Paraburkholderia ferrariae]|nr:hypothetical protein [Paraburkholderia ferrariae]